MSRAFVRVMPEQVRQHCDESHGHHACRANRSERYRFTRKWLRPNVLNLVMSPKVPAAATDNPAMKPENDALPESDREVFRQARVISAAVSAIRKAQGKASPGDFSIDTAEWLSAFEDFAHDLLRALADEGSPLALGIGPCRDDAGME